MKPMKRALFCLLLMLQTTTCLAIEPLACARKAFAQVMAAVYGVDIENMVVQPQHPGLPDNPYDALATPPFFAFRADWPGMDPGPRGFAAADGRVVATRSADAIRDLLEAAGMAQSPPPAEAIVRRLMWLYQPNPGDRLITSHPEKLKVTPPAIQQNGDGSIRIVWFVQRGGQTGFTGVHRAVFTLTAQNGPRFTESRLK